MPREAPPEEGLSPGALALHDYESGRPSEHEACRIGDARFLGQAPPGRPLGGAGAEGASGANKVTP